MLGPDSALIAESLLLADSSPLAAVRPLVAILGGDPVPGDLDRAHPAAVPLETGSVSVVIAVHAWQGRADPAGVVAEAQRLVVAGGSVILAELNTPKLARSTPRQYSSVLVRHIALEAAASLAAICVKHSDLEIEMTRAGLERVMTDHVDLARGLFADRAGHAARWLGPLAGDRRSHGRGARRSRSGRARARRHGCCRRSWAVGPRQRVSRRVTGSISRIVVR